MTWIIMNFSAVQSNLSYKGRDSHLRRSPRRGMRHSPSPSPTPLARIPKSKSHNANLSRKFSKAPEKRHRSLERNINNQVNGVNPRETFRLVDAAGRELARWKGSGKFCSEAELQLLGLAWMKGLEMFGIAGEWRKWTYKQNQIGLCIEKCFQ